MFEATYNHQYFPSISTNNGHLHHYNTTTTHSNQATLKSCNITSSISSSSNNSENIPLSSEFIDIKDLANYLNNDDDHSRLIILDTRLLKEYEAKHIKDSIHINCRDRITKNRLSSKKLSVRDIISCEKTKKKLDDSLTTTVNHNHNDCTTNKFNLTIIIYDDATGDSNDLRMQWNPLKTVLDNLNHSFQNSRCKILKGGFAEFAKNYSNLCINEDSDPIAKSVQLNEIRAARMLYGEDQHKNSIENAKITKINDYLYLGNERDSKNLDYLLEENIFYILNVTKNIPFYHQDNTSFHYKRISVNDSCGENLKNHFKDAFEFINEAKNNNCKVLVHCQAGVSRSPTIVIAYLMKTNKIKMQEAYNLVKEQRQIIDPNLVFMNQLDDYQSCLDESNEINNNNSNTCNNFKKLANTTTTTANTNNGNNSNSNCNNNNIKCGFSTVKSFLSIDNLVEAVN